MINTEELKISNKSYTNKDFQKIYPEILELAQSLSAKWDPTTSNESDPGVVLLKLLGFVADKLNYNIDKNILEAFIPSATQESSVRSNVELGGYYPRYYQSAITDVSFMYTGDKLKEGDSFTLKALETVISDVDGDNVFTLMKDSDVVINKRYETITVSAIEGTVEELLVNDVAEIHLDNLDENNRIYFPTHVVAENGVFIENVNQKGTFWSRVNNLNISEPAQRVFKFGYDSSRQIPYVEFPSDISILIEEGLHIRYIKTGGVAGNIKAGYLTRLNTPSKIISEAGVQIYPDSDNETEQGVIIINNRSGAVTGKDPETINEIYNSFKKVVGTFDTLVTTRDYANALYQLDSLLSNAQVGDRRTDINFSNQIITFGAYGSTKINATNPNIITASNLVLYPLKPPTTAYNSHEVYRRSFEPLNIESELKVITDTLEQTFYKTISQDYKTLGDEDIFLYKVYYGLNAKLTTNYKVNVYEESNIIENVNLALIQKFNSRELDYGYEIPFDILLETIQEADSRIKNVSLEEPDLVVKVMTHDGAETTLFEDNKKAFIEVLTKNILAGKVSLFDYNKDFDFEFGQVAFLNDISDGVRDYIHNNIKKMSTEVVIKNEDIVNNEYVLRENEYVQVIAPNMVTEVSYQPYTNYYWSGDTIDVGTEKTISGDDFLIIEYADSNDSRVAIKYTKDSIITYRTTKDVTEGEDYYEAIGGTVKQLLQGEQNIFKPIGFNLKKPTGTSLITKKIKFLVDTYPFLSIGTSESLEKRKFVQTTLKNKSLPCFWITNKPDNALFTDEDKVTHKEADNSNPSIEVDVLDGYEVVLGDNEYFLYSNPTLTELEVLGSGTRLYLEATTSEVLLRWKMNLEEDIIIDITEISDLGLGAFSQYSWKHNDLSNNNLTLSEMSVLTLGEGDTIKLFPKSPAIFSENIDNKWTPIPNNVTISYKLGEEAEETLDTFSDTETWKMRSRLDINAGPSLPQELLGGQTVILTLEDDTIRKIIGRENDYNNTPTVLAPNIAFSTLLQLAGGPSIDMEVTYVDGSTAFDINAFTFTYDIPTYSNKNSVDVEVTRGSSGYIQIPFESLKTSYKTEIDLPIVTYYDGSNREIDSTEGRTQLLMLYWNKAENSEDTIELITTGHIRLYNSGDSYNSNLTLNEGINIVEFDGISSITLEISTGSSSVDSLSIGPITITNSFNGSLGLENTTEYEKLLESIGTKDSERLFYYNGNLNNQDVIEFDDLTDARAFFDYNHVANKFTLPQINFDDDALGNKTKIAIVRTSKL